MERLKGMLFGAFIGDAFSLGYHWIYDTEKLKAESSKLNGYITPSKDSFHFGKRKGDFTHYGDQSLLMLKSISSNQGFSIEVFKTHWITYMSKYEGYLDHATKESLNLLDGGTHYGSSSDELGGLARIAPLVFYHFDDPHLEKFVEKQTRLTHNDEFLIEISHFFVPLLLELIIGKPIKETILSLSQGSPQLKALVDRVIERLNDDTCEVIKDFGQSCSSRYAFPAALYLMIKYAKNFEEAMRQNVLAGGDSAGRGMIIGMALGASIGYSHLPEDLIQKLNAFELIDGFTQRKKI